MWVGRVFQFFYITLRDEKFTDTTFSRNTPKNNSRSKNVFRRNGVGDRDRALQTVLDIVEKNPDRSLSPDIICLAGRIYKDKFIASNYEDRESLEKAIEWYKMFMKPRLR